jgi:hypothetical protein
MENIKNELLSEKLEATKKIFELLGFSNQEAEQHLEELGNTLTVKIITKLLEGKNFEKNENTSIEEITNFINKQYKQEEMSAIVDEEASDFLHSYFKVILKDDDEEKLSEIEKIINSK